MHIQISLFPTPWQMLVNDQSGMLCTMFWICAVPKCTYMPPNMLRIFCIPGPMEEDGPWLPFLHLDMEPTLQEVQVYR